MKMLHMFALSALLCGPAAAHEGHDHAAEPPLPAAVAAPRASAESELYELVAVLDGARLRVHLDTFAGNEPVSGARIEVESGSWKGVAAAVADGTYELPAGPVAQPGGHDLLFTILAGKDDDLLEARLEVPPPAPATAPTAHWPLARLLVVPLGLAALLGLILGLSRRKLA